MNFVEVPALNRLRDLDEVAAAFVYDGDARILAAAVPAHYTELVLEQLVRRLQQITDLVERAKIRLRETRFSFEGFTVWLKTFGQGLTLVVFVQPKAAIFPLRQPINLTVVNLEKALGLALEQSGQETGESLAAIAHRAEMELMRAQTGHQDQLFLDQMALLAEVLIGPQAQDIVNQSLREIEASTSFDTRPSMQRLAELIGENIPNVERRQFFLAEASDVIDRNEKQAPPPAPLPAPKA
jgi:hypothetical protein